MDCSHIQELITEYIDGMLDEDLKKEVESHMNTCDKCTKEYNLLKSIINSCHNLEEIDLPADFNQKLHDKLIVLNNINSKKKLSGMFLKYIKPIAAVLILGISLSIIVNSGLLKIGSAKKSGHIVKNEVSKSIAPQAVPQTTTQAAPQVAGSAEKGSDKPKAANADNGQADAALKDNKSMDYSFGSAVNKSYTTVEINLNADEYQKHYQDIIIIIEGLEGYLKNKEPLSYLMPQKNLDILLEKLKDSYGLDNALVITNDISGQYSSLLSEISVLEEKQRISSDSIEINQQLNSKKDELKELNSRLGNVVIEINRI